MANTLSVYTISSTAAQQATQATQTRPLSSYGMSIPMREVTRRALSLNARPLHALLATSTCTARVRLSVRPRSTLQRLIRRHTLPATVLIAHLRKHTLERL